MKLDHGLFITKKREQILYPFCSYHGRGPILSPGQRFYSVRAAPGAVQQT
jgi:hypothetical protein